MFILNLFGARYSVTRKRAIEVLSCLGQGFIKANIIF